MRCRHPHRHRLQPPGRWPAGLPRSTYCIGLTIMTDTVGPLTVIRGGTIATDYGVFRGHLAIQDGRIAGIAEDESALPAADEVIDARGLLILPGGVDPHCHFEEPRATEREDFGTGTMSAAAGGITTCIEHPLTLPPTTSAELLIEKRALAEARAVVDFGLYGGIVPDSIERIPAMH